MRNAYLSVLLLAAVGTAQADPAFDRLRDQLRQTITQQRQLEDENFTLKAKLAALDQSAPKAEAPKDGAEVAQLRASVRREAEKSAGLQKQLQTLNVQLQVLQGELAQANLGLKTQQESGTTLQTQLQALNNRQKITEEANQKVQQLAFELLDKYQRQTLWQALGNHEPVTQLYRVRLENLIQDYQTKLINNTLLPMPTEAVESSPNSTQPTTP